MKKIILTITALFFCLINYSQSPEKFTYQSIVRAADGSILKTTSLGIRISILKSSKNGTTVYSETHTVSSNINGLVTFIIGDGITSDKFSDIDWSTGEYFLKVQVDPTGGINYAIEQSSQLLSVPYALYAGNSSSSDVDLSQDVIGVLPVPRGGTGSSTSPMIGLVTAPNASVAREMLGTTPVSLGGTGSTTSPMIGVVTAADAAAARAVLEIDKTGTDNSTPVSLAYVTNNYLELNGQKITSKKVPITLGGTGSSTAPMVGVITAANPASARTVLGIEDATIEKYTIPVSLKYVPQNYLELNGQQITSKKVPITLGGTGSSTAPMVAVITAADAAAARKVLGVDAAGSGGQVFLSTVKDNYLSIQNATDNSGNQTLTAGTVPITLGGTGSPTAPMVAVITAADAAAARTILGLEDAIETFTVPVSLKNVQDNYLTLSGQELISGIVPVTLGGTGSNSAPMVAVITAANAAAARTVLEIDKAGTDNSTAVTLANVSNNYLSLNGQEITSGIVPITLGGTGSSSAPMVGVITASNASSARTVLGLGTIAVQNKNAVDIDGGAIDGTTIGANTPESGGFTTVQTTDNVSIGGNSKELRFYSGSDYVGFKAPSLSATKIWTLPLEDGSANQVLKTDGSGNLSWATNSGSGAIAIDDLTDAKKAGTNFTGSMLIGNETPGTLDDGDAATYNIGVGEIALDALTTGDNNIAVGYNALTAITVASANTAIGAGAGEQNVTGGDNVFVGKSAGDANTSGQQNVIIGSGSDPSAADGANQIAIGYGVTGGGNNTVVLGNGEVTTWLPSDNNEVDLGTSAKQMKDIYVDGVAYADALGFGTTAITLPTADGSANQVLKTDGSGTLSWTANSGSGASAIDDLTDGKSGGTDFTGSMILGHQTTGTLDAAQYNTAVGLTALDAVTTGDDNTAVGHDALTGATTGSKNVAVGKGAMTAAVTGEGNMAVGYNALNSLTSGGGNVAIGRQVLSKVEGGSKNVGIGRQAGIQIVNGDVGGTSLVSGSQNTYIGAETVPSSAAATNETVIGQGATGGGNNTVVLGNGEVTTWQPTDNNEVDLGTSAKQMKDVYVDGVTYTDAIGFGTTAMTLPTADGSANQVLKTDGSGTLSWTANSGSGASAIDDLSDGKSGGTDFTGSMILGHQTTGTLDEAEYNTAVGINAMDAMTTGDKNTALGYDALTAFNGGGGKNVAVGHEALVTMTSGNSNTAVGANAMHYNATGSYSTAFGSAALFKQLGSANTAVGYAAMNGNSVLHDTNTGGANTAMGYKTLRNNSSAYFNSAFGSQALDISNADGNSAFGRKALYATSSGPYNTAMGHEAGDVNTTGTQNVMIGASTDPSANNGTNQIAIGYGATGLGDNKAVIGNASVTDVYMAQDMGATVHADGVKFYEDTGNGTNYVGFNSAATLGGDQVWTLPAADGSANQVLKTDGSGVLDWVNNSGVAGAIDDLTDGKSGGTDFTGSMILGHQTTGTLNDAQYNTAVGINAMDALTGGDYNTAVGHDALTSNDLGKDNAAYGFRALYSNMEGDSNVAVGYYALLDNTYGDSNTAVGDSSLNNNTTGGKNTALGEFSLASNTTAGSSTAVGYKALQNATGDSNTAMGFHAGDVITSGRANIIIGENSDPSADDTDYEIVIGAGATGKGTHKAVIGSNSTTDVYMAQDMGATVHADGVKFYEDTGNGTNYVGFNSAATLGGDQVWTLPTADGSANQVLKTDGSGVLAWVNNSGVAGAIDDLSDGKSGGTDFTGSMILGHQTTGTLSNAQYNTAVGATALQSITQGDRNTAIGSEALKSNTTGNYNTALGFEALKSNTIGIENTASGSRALESNTEGGYNTASGYFALQDNTTGSGNTASGSRSLYSNTTGANNTALGKRALQENTTGTRNIAIGSNAYDNADQEHDNLAIGYDALGGTVVNGSTQNIAIGNYSLDANTSGGNNTTVGYNALTSNTTGASNTAMGHEAGDVNTTGTQNVMIGASTDPSANNGTNQIAIGYGATGLGDNKAVIGNASVTDVYMAQDMGATVHADGVKFYEDTGNGSNYVGFNSAATLGGDQVWTLPAADGSANQVLKTDGSGTLSWTANSGSGASAIDDLTDGKSEGSSGSFTDSMILGHATTGSLSNAHQNTGVGHGALDAITSGDSNTAVGNNALTSHTTANGNTALGAFAMQQNVSGNHNTAVGFNTLGNNLTGVQSVAIGGSALANALANYNVAVGYNAGDVLTSGHNNVLLGTSADPSTNNAVNQIVIGYDATGIGNNKAVIGGAAITDVYMAQDMGATVHADGVKFYEDTGNGSNYVGFNSAATLGGDQVWTLPAADGSANQVLKTDGSGTLSWTANSGVAGAIDDLSDGKSAGANFTGSMILGHETTGTLNQAQYNTAVGLNAMDALTSGDWNTAVGYSALGANTDGENNVAIGRALEFNTSGDDNTAVGHMALYSNTTGKRNAAVGKNALYANTSADNNTAIGWEALKNNTTGANNTATGLQALYFNTTGDSNTATGYGALNKNTTGGFNTAYGVNALEKNTTANNLSGDYNVALGYEALRDNTTADHNIAIGAQALKLNTTGTRNIVIGYRAYDGGDEEHDNLAIGYEALGGAVVDGSTQNIAIGNYSLDANTSGGNNTAVGYNALTSNSTGGANIAIGGGSLDANTTGGSNTAVGWGALTANIDTGYSTGVGRQALGSSTGASNTAMGYRAGNTIVAGTNNVVIGMNADVDAAGAANRIVIGKGASGTADNTAVIGNTDIIGWLPPDDNGVDLGTSSLEFKDVYVDGVTYTDALGFGTVAITLPTADGSANQVLKTDGSGTLAWVNNSGVAGGIDDLSDGKIGGTDFTGSMILGHQTTGTLDAATYNTAVGITALDAITTGDYNVAVGYNALGANTTGNGNTAIGHEALKVSTIGNYNSASGMYSLRANTEGSYNIASGVWSLGKNTTGSNNIAFGQNALKENTIGTYNIAFGYMSLDANTEGTNNIASGNSSLTNNTIGSNNVASGKSSLSANTEGDYNIAIGYQSLMSNTTADRNIAVGAEALKLNTTGTRNIAIGSNAYDNADTENDNIAIGYAALGGAINGGENNVAIGSYALLTNTAGDANTATGFNALKVNTTGNYNTAFGAYGLSNHIDGHNNTALGHSALIQSTTAASNIGIGYQAGDVITTGSNNVIIGEGSDPSANNGTNQIVIGQGVTGTGDNQIALGNTSITHIKAQVNSITAYSDRRIKREINNSKIGLDFIMKLRPVTYKMKNPADYPDEILEDRFRGDSTSGPNDDGIDQRPADDETIYDGLIAQEVKQAMDKTGINWSGWSKNESDGKQGVQYGALTIPLIKAVQEQQETIDSQNKEIENLKDRLKRIEAILSVGN